MSATGALPYYELKGARERRFKREDLDSLLEPGGQADVSEAKATRKPRRRHGEGAIYQRSSDGRWIGAIDLGRMMASDPSLRTGKTAKEVGERMKALLRDQQLGRMAAGGRVKTGRYLNEWLSELARPRPPRLSTATGP